MEGSPDTTTLVFTDIEGSTRLWEQDSEGMSRALAAHDAASLAAVAANRGVMVKMTGDGMYAYFADPVDAVNATVALQKTLTDLVAEHKVQLRVRAGLHLGIVERRNDDLFGSPVNRAARIMKAAHGGQILVSQAVVDAVRERLPTAVSMVDLGSVRLRDLASSEHVYQIVHPQLRKDFPALRSLEATPNNLPQQMTSFIGRERELTEAKALLEKTRLLTLLGMGGLGKTRLSLQIGADVLEKYPDGVWFVDLAPLRDPALVPNVTAQVLGLHEEPGRPLMQTLCAHLKEHTLLVIIDNCEHMVAACARLADALLQGAPNLRILTTSREALHIRGEQTYPVYPLAVPDRKGDVDSLLRSEAVQLFVERARLQKPGFTVTERDAPAVAELCARLEGIPLALELAAARLRSLSVADINVRLHDRFKLLTGGSRVALERQQTLRALVSWSYDLLQPNEQILLDRLSIFAGGFDLLAAEAVCGAEPLLSEDVLDLVTSMVEKSLVMLDQGDGEGRYGMLETIREFAHGHLVAQGQSESRYDMLGTIREFAHEGLVKRDDVTATATRHCAFYFDLAKTARGKLRGLEQAEWTQRLEVELDNIRAAIAFSIAGAGDATIAVKFAVALMRFWIFRGYSTEGRSLVRTALALPSFQEANPGRAHALYVGGVLATNQGDHAGATAMLTECLAIRRGLDNPRETAATLSTLSVAYLHAGDPAKARDCEEEGLGIFRKLGDRVGEGIGLVHIGEICVQLGIRKEAQERFEQCLTLARAIKHQELESECERNLGELALDTGDVVEARRRLQRSLDLCQAVGDRRGDATTVAWLGRADIAEGLMDSAKARLSEALRAFQNFEMNAEALDCLEDYARLLQKMDRTETAVQLLAAAASVRETLVVPRSANADAKRKESIDGGRAALGEGAFQTAWAVGKEWELDEAIQQALSAPTASAVTA